MAKSAASKRAYSTASLDHPEQNAVIHVGDEIRRKLPNGTEETFEVVDPVYYEGLGGAIPPHYQVKIRRKGAFPSGTGGHLTFNVSGQNSRVNIGSVDRSTNLAASGDVFDFTTQVTKSISDPAAKKELIAAIEEIDGIRAPELLQLLIRSLFLLLQIIWE